MRVYDGVSAAMRFRGGCVVQRVVVVFSVWMWVPVLAVDGLRVDLADLEPEDLACVRESSGVQAWVELDSELFLLADEVRVKRAFPRLSFEVVARNLTPDHVVCVFGVYPAELPGGVRILARGGRALVLDHWPGKTEAGQAWIRPVQGGLVAARAWNPLGVRQSRGPMSAFADAVDESRWMADIQTLAGFNRYTYGPGVLQARDWLVQSFEAMPGMKVTVQGFSLGSTDAFNVVAELPGDSDTPGLIIVGAHYDAKSEAPLDAAPGAEDNASGVAAVLELARIFSGIPHRTHTLQFVCYSAEEQGFYGSEAHVNDLLQNWPVESVHAVFIMDMVGYTSDDDLDCLLETSSTQRDLAYTLASVAEAVTDLRIVTSFFPFGSDHMSYLDAGLPALLVIENDWDEYPYYHSTQDLPQWLSLEMGREILRMNAAALAQFSGASNASHVYFIPHVPPDNHWQVDVALTAAGDGNPSLFVEWFQQESGEGVPLEAMNVNLPAWGSTSLDIPGQGQRWARVQSTTPLAGLCVFGTNRGGGLEKAALNLSQEAEQSATLIFPHVPSDRQQFWSGCVLLNTTEDTTSLMAKLFDTRGGNANVALLPSYQTPWTLAAHAKQVLLFQSPDGGEPLFDDSDLDSPVAWIQIQANDVPILGFELFGKTGRGSHGELAGLKACALEGNGVTGWPWARTKDLDYRGLALLNPQPQPISLETRFLDTSGQPLLEPITLTLEAHERVLGLLDAQGLAWPYTPDSPGVRALERPLASLEFCPSEPFIGVDLSGTSGFRFDGAVLSRPTEHALFGGLQALHLQMIQFQLLNDAATPCDVIFIPRNAVGREGESVQLSLNPGQMMTRTIDVLTESVASLEMQASGPVMVTGIGLDSSASECVFLQPVPLADP